MRAAAWLTGCQLRCPYCHDPDTRKMTYGVPVALEGAKAQLGIEYKLRDADPPSKESIEHTCAQFQSAGLNVY